MTGGQARDEARGIAPSGESSGGAAIAPRRDPRTGSGERPSVAVVGAGVAGLTAAYLLRSTHDVTLFEAEPRLGGHAHTHDLPSGVDGLRRQPSGLASSASRQTHPRLLHPSTPAGRGDSRLAVDSGFIVHNDRTYPLLRRLFAELDVAVQPAEMSMSVSCDGCGLEYAGGRGPSGVFAQRRRAASPRFLAMLGQVARFNAAAKRYLADTGADDLTTLGDFLAARRFGDYFVRHYTVAVVSCVWSAGHADALSYPARYLFEFLHHHGLLDVTGRDSWATVVGGSRAYVDAVRERLDDVRLGVPVRGITRKPDGVEVHDDADKLRTYDRVVLATHADVALQLLTDASDDEHDVLGAFGYSANETLLHTDDSVLPTAARARASWNYRMRSCGQDENDEDKVLVSYWMNHLQHLDADVDYIVTLNPHAQVREDAVVARMTYTHPIYTPAAVAAQSRLPELATDSTVFAGAYHGWGFHEDGCRSGVAAAAHFGATW